MDIINNRYRVLKFLKQNKLTSSYLVHDLNLQNKIVLNIINYDRVQKEFVNYCINEFINWTNIDSERINKVYNFGVINLVDNKRLNDVKYFYTNEYYDEDKSFINIIKQINDPDEIIDVFVKVCEAIDYFHLKGFVYGELNLNSICLNGEEIKLKDIPTIKLENMNDSNIEEIYLTKYNNKNINNKNIYFDIYNLGLILFDLCTTNCIYLPENLFKSNDIKTKSKLSSEFINDIQKVVKKCIDTKNGYNSVRDIVKDINRIFQKCYHLRKINEISKVNLNCKLVDREEETNLIMKDYKAACLDDLEDRIVLVHGDTGIGKTKLLKNITYSLTYNRANIYTSFSLSDENNHSFNEILKQMISESDEKILEKYKHDLINFAPEIKYNSLDNKKNIEKYKQDFDVSKEKLKLINRIYGFINDFTKYKSIVIMIDDIHLVDEFSIQILSLLCSRKIKNKSILIILSYCDGRHVLNKSTLEFIQRIKFKNNVRDIRLGGLNEKQTGEMIKYMLGMHSVPKKFASIVYCKSYGNPLFINELIKDFYNKGIIYINNQTGQWYTDYIYKEIPIPSDINQILLNQIKDVDAISYNILFIIATFLKPVTIETITFMSGYSVKSIKDRINKMLDKGILCKKISDQGFTYDFYNKLFKDLIYNRISKEECKQKHKLASQFMEKQYLKGYDQYAEELIYHLKKAHENFKVTKYCIENARRMKKFNNYIEAIKNLKCALEFLSENNIKGKKFYILKEISKLYEHIGKFNSAIEYLVELNNVAKEQNNIKYQVYSLNRQAEIYCYKNNLDKVQHCIDNVVEIVNEKEDFNGFLNYKLVLARLYSLQGKYKKAKDICFDCINMCSDEYEISKAHFYNLLSLISIINYSPHKAEEYLKNSINILSKFNDAESMVRVLNNLAAIYGDYYQDKTKASQYYRQILEISKENNLIVGLIIASNNLGECYYYQQNYDEALKKFHEVEEKSKKYDFESATFYSYVYLCKIYLKKADYKNAYSYYNLCNKELGSYVIAGNGILEYYKACTEFFLDIGNLKVAEKYINKSMQIFNQINDYENYDSMLKLTSKFLIIYIKIFNSNESNFKNLLIEAQVIIDKILNNYVKTCILCKLDWLLYNKGFYDEGKKILEDAKSIVIDIENLNYLNIYITYLDVMYNDKDKIKGLNRVLEMAKKIENKKIQSQIYGDIGDCYFYKKDYFNAFVYYFECYETSMEMIKSLPDEYKKIFIRFYNIDKVISRLKSIKSYYYGDSVEIENTEIKDINLEKITNVVDFINCKDIMENKHFMKSVKKFYSSLFDNEIHDVNDILKNTSSDDMENLNILLQYMLYITMSTSAHIVLEKDGKFNEILYSGNNKDVPLDEQDYYVIEECKTKKHPILVSNIDDYRNIKLKLVKDIKACACIPIMLNINKKRYYGRDNRGKELYDTVNTIAYVYLRSNRALNNISLRTIKKCRQLNGLIGLMIEKYKLNKTAAYDKLTGVLTRKYLEEEIEKNLDMAAENNGVFSMIMFDLDHFKNINDKFGHQTGDEVLKRVCNIVLNNIRNTDICGRYGGEEFIILLKNSYIDDAKNVAEKLRKKIEQDNIIGDKAKITVSMGLVEYPKQGQWKEELIEKVDQALYVAKENGRNQCRVWNQDMSSKVKATNKLTGIITGDEVRNNRNVLVMVELIELLNKKMLFNDKIYNVLGRVIEITESQYGILFKIDNNNISQIFARKAFEECWMENYQYNKNIVESVIQNNRGTYFIDWDNIIQKDPITGTPDWQSLIVIPITKSDNVKGVLYLSTPIRNKEFGFEDFNYVATLVKIISNMM